MNSSPEPSGSGRPSGLPYPADPPVIRDDLPDRGAGAPASWGKRAGARLLDVVLVSFPSILAAQALGMAVVEGDGGAAVRGARWPLLIFPVAFVVYETVLIGWRGNTLGKYAFRARVVSWERGDLPTYQEAAIRALVPGVFLIVAFASVGSVLSFLLIVPVAIYLSSVADAVYRGWHDKAADTIVLSAPRRGLL